MTLNNLKRMSVHFLREQSSEDIGKLGRDVPVKDPERGDRGRRSRRCSCKGSEKASAAGEDGRPEKFEKLKKINS